MWELYHQSGFTVLISGIYFALWLSYVKNRREHNSVMARLTIVEDLTEKINKVVEDKLLNNFKGELTEIMYELLNDFDNDTLLKSAMWAYLRIKLNDIHQRYVDIKNAGLKRLYNESFQKDLIGASGAELAALSSGFNKDFISKIDEINRVTLKAFLESITNEIALEGTNNWLFILKTHGKNFFRRNINLIVKEFQKYPEHFSEENPASSTRMYTPNLARIRQTVIKKDFKEYLRDEIATGMVGLENAINELNIYQLNEENRTTVSQLSARYFDLKTQSIRGLINIDSKDYNQLRNNLLNFIDTI